MEVDLDRVRPDPELARDRDFSGSCPICPACGTFSTRLSGGRFWCGAFSCDLVFRHGGPGGLIVVGRVVRHKNVPLVVLPAKTARVDGPDLSGKLGDEATLNVGDLTWHALYVRTGREAEVRDKVSDLGLAAYMPLRITWVRRPIPGKARREFTYEERRRPLLRGYVLVGLWPNTSADWQALCTIRGVIGYLETDEGPTEIPAKQVFFLQDRERRGEWRDAEPKHRRRGELARVKAGDEVELEATGQPYQVEGIEGVYALLKGSRVKVHLASLRKAS